jgi:simple sugar transport system permease protein
MPVLASRAYDPGFTPWPTKRGMTVGMGFIALALTMVGGWNPYRILVAAVLFGLLRSLGNGLQILGVDIRTEFVNMLPYIGITLGSIPLVLLIAGTRSAVAAAVAFAPSPQNRCSSSTRC